MAGRTADETGLTFLPARPGKLSRATAAALLLALGVAGCSPSLSPNTYNASAVQQANKADQGVVVGVRQVDVRVSGTTGAVIGGAAGGIAGSQAGDGATSAFGALGGSVLGGLIGTGVEHAGGDTQAWEYIVRKGNKELVSVTQKDEVPLVVGQHVLVITGPQARIVADYTVSLPAEPAEADKPKADAKKPAEEKKPTVIAPASDAPKDASAGDAPKDAAAGDAPKDAPSGDAPKAAGTEAPKDSVAPALPSSTSVPSGTVTLPTDDKAAAPSTSGTVEDSLSKTAAKAFSAPSSAVSSSAIPDVSVDDLTSGAASALGK